MTNENETKFNRMLDLLVRIVEDFNKDHARGQDFGSGHKLFPAEIHTIQAIGDNPGITITKLAQLLGVSKATVSERINKFEKRSLVNKAKATDNAKEILLLLTVDGQKDYDGHALHHQSIFQLFYKHLGDDPEQSIEKFTDAFKDYVTITEKIGSSLKGHESY